MPDHSFEELTGTGENNLSFIETSALDASNVELAFQNILTGLQFLVLLDDVRLIWIQKFTASSQVKLSTTAKLAKTQI